MTLNRDKEYTELHKSKYLSVSPERNDVTTKNVYSINQTQNKKPYVSYINSSLENHTMSNRKRIVIENMLDHERTVAKKLNQKISRNISILQKSRNKYDMKLL